MQLSIYILFIPTSMNNEKCIVITMYFVILCTFEYNNITLALLPSGGKYYLTISN
jgi:hypothetical protein